MGTNRKGFKGLFGRGKKTTNTATSATTNATNKEKTGGGFDLGNFGFGGMVGAGVNCKSDDDSFFCSLTKFTSIISQLIYLIMVFGLIVFVLFYFVFPFIRKNVYGKRK